MSCIASALAMQLGEANPWHAAQAAVRPDLVVGLPLDRYGHPGLMQGLKPALVEVLVTELAVEALYVAVLHGMPRLDLNVANAMRLCLGHEDSAGELQTVVSSHRLRVPTEQRSAVQHPGNLLT